MTKRKQKRISHNQIDDIEHALATLAILCLGLLLLAIFCYGVYKLVT